MKLLSWTGLGLLFTLSVSATQDTSSGFISKADSLLSSGDVQGALAQYDSAIKLDPKNYLYLFKRGAALLSIGKDNQALKDFDKALDIEPKLEMALHQRARINLKSGKIQLALDDAQHLSPLKGQTIIENAASCSESWQNALKSFKKNDIEGCLLHSSNALSISPNALEMRQLRSKCRIINGDLREALVDLSNIESLLPSNPDAFIKSANIYYYNFHEYDLAMQNLRRCLQYDPDCKGCLNTHKMIKKSEKKIKKFSKSSLGNVPSNHGTWDNLKTTLITEGLYNDIKKEVNDNLKKIGIKSQNSDLLNNLKESICEAYYNTKDYSSQGQQYCKEALENNNSFITSILYKASMEMNNENYEVAAQILFDFQQKTSIQDNKLNSMLRQAQILARRAKEKDYYKVLGVSRDATDKEIKKAYRSLSKTFHPDKYRGEMTAEQVERKMSDINEAYEVLSNEEKRNQFDNGQDPNNPQQGPPGGNPFRGGGSQFHFQGAPNGGFYQGNFDFSSFQEQFMKQQFRGRH